MNYDEKFKNKNKSKRNILYTSKRVIERDMGRYI